MKEDRILGLGLAALVAIAVIIKVVRFIAAHWPWFALLAVILLVIGVWLIRLHYTLAEQERAEWLRINAHLTTADRMNGDDFEQLIAALLHRDGYRRIDVQGGCGDGGIDITAETPDRSGTVAIQCKRHSRNIGVSYVREMIGALHDLAPCLGLVVTTAEFSKPAKDTAQRAGILLIGRERLGEWMNGTPLQLSS